jgi:hypothetical protein
VAEQPWDTSIQSMAVVPEAVDRLANDIQWTTELGNAFLAQQSDVMDAVQRMRKKAQDKGALESNEQQVVETKVVARIPLSFRLLPPLHSGRRVRYIQLRRHVGRRGLGWVVLWLRLGRQRRRHQHRQQLQPKQGG